MDRHEQQDGRQRVLVHLIRPLNEVLRWKRPRGVSEWQQAAGLGEVQQRLAHLSADELVTLRETLIEAGRGAGPAQWPTPGTIIAQGLALRLPEDGVTERVRKVLAWAADKGVMPSADLPWLLMWLRRHARIPTNYDFAQIAAQVEADRRALARIRSEAAAGVAMSSADAQLSARIERATALTADILGARAGVAA